MSLTDCIARCKMPTMTIVIINHSSHVAFGWLSA